MDKPRSQQKSPVQSNAPPIRSSSDGDGAIERERAGLLRVLFDLDPNPKWLHDGSTQRILAVNEAALETYGYSEAGFLALTHADLWTAPEGCEGAPDGGHDAHRDADRMPMTSAQIVRHRTKDGQVIEVEIRSRPLPEWGELVRVFDARDVTIARRAIRALESSERRFRDIFEHTTAFICIHDFAGSLLAVNAAAAAALGYAVGELIGTQFRDLIAPERRRFFDDYLERISSDGDDAGYLVVCRRDGARLIWQYRNRIFSDGDGIRCVIAHAQDVTSARAAEEALRLGEQRLRTVADMLPVAIAYMDSDFELVFANETYRREHDLAEGFSARHIRKIVGEERYAARLPYIKRALDGERVVWNEESGSGEDYRCVEVTYTPEFGAHGVIGVHAMLQDVTSRKIEERRLVHLARVDPLTGLLNRAGFYNRLENALERSRDQGSLLAVFYLDLDHFKQINDTHGHAIGDALLRAFAQRLTAKVRASDVAARIGGDEFTLVMEALASDEHVRAIAATLVDALARPFELGALVLSVRSSIGIALARAPTVPANVMVELADSMLYQAKQAGRGCFRIEMVSGGKPRPGHAEA